MQEEITDRLGVLILMLTYNHSKYIAQAIESVLSQETTFPVCLYISDDASTDNTIAIVSSFNCTGNIEIIVHREEKNIGAKANGAKSRLYAARSHYRYIAILEGDDYWTDPMKLQKQVEFLEANPLYSMVFTNRNVLHADGSIVFDDHYTKEKYTVADVVAGFIPPSQTLVFKRSVEVLKYFEQHKDQYSADRFLTYYYALQGPMFRLSHVTSVYRLQQEGMWNSFQPLEKSHQHFLLLKDFHKAIGLPLLNSVLAQVAFNNSVTTLTYCVKRPHLLLRKSNLNYIFRPFLEFWKMNVLYFFCKAILSRLQ